MKKYLLQFTVILIAQLDTVHGEETILIENFTVGTTEISFSFVQPPHEYLVGTSPDLKNWNLTRIFTSNQERVNFTKPRVIDAEVREFFIVCELPTTNKVHSGDFDFNLTVNSVEDGQLFKQNGGSSVMQEVPDSEVGQTEEVALIITVDLNDLTIDFLGLTDTIRAGLSFRTQRRLPE